MSDNEKIITSDDELASPSSSSNKNKPQKTKKQRKKDIEDDRLLSSFISQNRVNVELNTNKALFYFAVAFLTSLLPVYLFQGVRNLDFEGITIVLYLVITSVSAALVTLAYHNIFVRTRPRVQKQYEGILEGKSGKQLTKQEKKDLDQEKDKLAEMGSTGYAIFFTNIFYLSIVLFLSFYVLQRVDVRLFVQNEIFFFNIF